jgi:hypothetical protein
LGADAAGGDDAVGVPVLDVPAAFLGGISGWRNFARLLE